MITQINVENFMRISDVQIKPDGALVRIEGMNNQGKSSFLKALVATLGDKRAEPKDPIKHGTDEAKTVIHLSVKCEDCDGEGTVDHGEGDHDCEPCEGTGWIPKYIVTKTWKGNKSELVLTSSDKKRIYSTPRKLIDALYVDAGFDVLAFVMMKRKERDDFFVKLIGLDFTEIDAATQGAFEARTVQNRGVKDLEGSLNAMAEAPDGTPGAEVSVSDLIQQRDEAQQIATDNKSHKDHMAVVAGNLDEATEEIARIEKVLAEAKERKVRLHEIYSGLEIREAKLPQVPDIEAITTQIDNAEQTNANVRIKLARIATKNLLTSAKAKSEVMTADIEKLRSDRLLMIESADMPLPELSYDYEHGVMYDGVPYEQASQSDQIMASTALGFKLNPDKIAIIQDGSLLDENRLAELEAFAEKEKGQIFIERVSDGSGPVGFVIDDGELVEQAEASSNA